MDLINQMQNIVANINIKEYEGKPVVSSREIAIDFEKNHKEVLSEELGHYFTSVGDNLINMENYRDYLKICKCEKQALNWSVNTVIKNIDLENSFKNNCASYYEIAEFLNVPEKLVIEKFKYLASKNNTGYIELGEYKIILTNLPNIIVYKEI